MIEQIANTVAEKTGLSPEQSMAAANAVIGFLGEKLPEPAAGMLKGYVGGGNAEGGEGEGGGLMDTASGMLGNVSGMFGGK
jgi:hypothetical protein